MPREKQRRTAHAAGGGFHQEQAAFEHPSAYAAEGQSIDAHVAISDLVLRQAAVAGLLGGEKTARIGGRVAPELLCAARRASGIQSDTELLEYALSKVALEDDFGAKLLARKGSVPDDVEL